MAKKVLYWLRNDLRVNDNYPLVLAEKEAGGLFPVYCFDERWFRKDSLGFPRTDYGRFRFLCQSLENLHEKFVKLGSGLYITVGKPEEQIPPLAYLFGAEEVWAMREACYDEILIERELEQGLPMPLRLFDTAPLLPSNLLPYSLNQLPEVFTSFRKTAEPLLAKVRALPVPTALPPYPHKWGFGEMPAPSRFGLTPWEPDPRTAVPFQGGEDSALGRLSFFLDHPELIKQYKDTRNGLIGSDYSSKFSIFLAYGTLSARMIFGGIRAYIQKNGLSESSGHFVSELLWRDYFRLIARKHGKQVFSPKGINGKGNFYRDDRRLFLNWTQGKTGRDFVDSNMLELLHTGFMSNRGRQNVASFLCKDLKIDWRWGARWFESRLLDYDGASNWGNWMYVAGVGNDPRPDRYFNVEKQAEMYDPDKQYRKLWLPQKFGPQPGNSNIKA